MIHWPMTTEQTVKGGLTIVPRSKADPTRSAKHVTAMFRDVEERYFGISARLKPFSTSSCIFVHSPNLDNALFQVLRMNHGVVSFLEDGKKLVYWDAFSVIKI